MTDEELKTILDEMLIMFGDNLPNPEQEPIRFKTYVKWYKFYKQRRGEGISTKETPE